MAKLTASHVLQTLQTHPPAAAAERIIGWLDRPADVDAVFDGLSQFPGELDKRVIAAVTATWEIAPDKSIRAHSFFEKRQGQPAVHEALACGLESLADRGVLPVDPYAYGLFVNACFPSCAPALARLTALAAPSADFRLHNLVNALDRIGEVSVLPALRTILETTLPTKAKKSLKALVASLEKRAGLEAPAAPKGGGKAKRAAASTPGSESTRGLDALTQRLLDAGLRPARAKAIAKQARARIDLRVAPNADLSLGASHFGGVPDLPADTPWPHATIAEEELVLSPSDHPPGTLPAPGYHLGIPGVNEQLLLSVSSEPQSDFMWNDASSIFFCIPSRALAALDSTRAYCVADE